ncbi:MAG: AMP-binding protein [Deltaproteobacteria bacterium]|jgi:fatty-acyl-CoA synthase|nr:AMP-binding protein [Deltaproteobacteria bacterium]
MTGKLIDRTASAYDDRLLIKRILDTAFALSGGNEIVCSCVKRYDYKTLYKRIGQLANVLNRLGIKAGDTVGILDWDSHRYLECLFSVPMMGAVLHTLNVRRPSEELLYTLNHAEDHALLVHADFLPLVEKIQGAMKTVKSVIVLTDGKPAPQTCLDAAGDYETLLEESPGDFDFLDFNENLKAATFYTTDATGMLKEICFSNRQLVLHALAVASSSAQSAPGGMSRNDVYMPLTPISLIHAWGFPYAASMLGMKQVYPGRYTVDMLLGLIAKERVTFSHCVPAVLHMLLGCPASAVVDLSGLTVITSGSAVSKELCRAARQRGINVYTGYGLSETCPVLTTAHIEPLMAALSEKEQTDLHCRADRPLPLCELARERLMPTCVQNGADVRG